MILEKHYDIAINHIEKREYTLLFNDKIYNIFCYKEMKIFNGIGFIFSSISSNIYLPLTKIKIVKFNGIYYKTKSIERDEIKFYLELEE